MKLSEEAKLEKALSKYKSYTKVDGILKFMVSFGYKPNLEFDGQEWCASVVPPSDERWGTGFNKNPVACLKEAFKEALLIQSQTPESKQLKTEVAKLPEPNRRGIRHFGTRKQKLNCA